MTNKIILALITIFAPLLFSAITLATEFDHSGFNKFMACQSACVDDLDACHVTLEPKCKNLKDKSECYEPCNTAYTACLGECAKSAPNMESLPFNRIE